MWSPFKRLLMLSCDLGVLCYHNLVRNEGTLVCTDFEGRRLSNIPIRPFIWQQLAGVCGRSWPKLSNNNVPRKGTLRECLIRSFVEGFDSYTLFELKGCYFSTIRISNEETFAAE